MAALDRAGFRYATPDGGFFLWLRLPDRAAGPTDDVAFAARLVREHAVAVAPGAAFGARGAGWLRLSLTAADHDLRTGIERIATLAQHTDRPTPSVARPPFARDRREP
jgi:aspartate/methionine/tyrosine aminotransferase